MASNRLRLLLFITAVQLSSNCSPVVSAAEVLSCTTTYHMHKHALTVRLDGDRLMSFVYLVNVTAVPAGNDFCVIDGNRNDRDQMWTTKGRKTTITLKSEDRPVSEGDEESIPEWRVVAEGDRKQWKLSFEGLLICSPSAVHATEIAIRKNSKRCVLVNVAE